jgi:small-conductance mechanosensitive channel
MLKTLMIEYFDIITNQVISAFNYATDFIPLQYHKYFVFCLMTLGIVVYSIFVWKFYRFLAKRDLLELNLRKYNKVEHPTLNKVFAIVLFIIEYIIILPFITFFWFFIMSIILFFLARDLAPENILLISGGIIGAIRITAYYNEDLSKDLAKMFPFTILAISLVTPGFFKIGETVAKLGRIDEVLVNVVTYLFMIMVLEFILRILYLISPEGQLASEK